MIFSYTVAQFLCLLLACGAVFGSFFAIFVVVSLKFSISVGNHLMLHTDAYYFRHNNNVQIAYFNKMHICFSYCWFRPLTKYHFCWQIADFYVRSRIEINHGGATAISGRHSVKFRFNLRNLHTVLLLYLLLLCNENFTRVSMAPLRIRNIALCLTTTSMRTSMSSPASSGF